jgi:hypothetical protein
MGAQELRALIKVRQLHNSVKLDLTDEESAALLRELNNIIENDRYPLSQRIRTLRGIRAKFPTAPREPRRPGRRRPKNAVRGVRHALWSATPLGLMTPLGTCDDHIYCSAPAARAHERIAPTENAGPRAILSRHIGRVRLDLVAAGLAPHDEPDASRSRVAERHRWSGVRFHISEGSILRIARSLRAGAAKFSAPAPPPEDPPPVPLGSGEDPRARLRMPSEGGTTTKRVSVPILDPAPLTARRAKSVPKSLPVIAMCLLDPSKVRAVVI